MKLYAPKYYKDFACIADKCNHSCCIGWEIDIDGETLKKYRALSDNYAKEITSSIDADDTPHFRLASGGRCPHLNNAGLCEIILNLGDEHLCDICREHPRFYNDLNVRREVGIGMACEEACRIILDSDDYSVFIEAGETDGEAVYTDFDAGIYRERVYAVLSDNSLSYGEKLSKIHRDHGITLSALSDNEWREMISSLEYLDEAHKILFLKYSSDHSVPSEYEKTLERALAYFVFRHCTKAQAEDEFRIALGFCLFCERLLASVLREEKARDISDIIRLARVVSEEIEYSEENTDAIMLEFSLL